jgi:hypothetical protein
VDAWSVVQVIVAPDGVTELTVTPEITGGTGAGFTVREAVVKAPAHAAVIVTDVEDATAEVLIVNVANEAPDGTVTVAGTVAALLLLYRLTTIPLEGAIAFR